MLNAPNKVQACVDQSQYAQYVAQYAAWAAARMDAPLEFLHVIDKHTERAVTADLSGSIGIDAQANLLKNLSDEDEARHRDLRERGRLFLNELCQLAIAQGVERPDMRQRFGHLDEIAMEQQHGVRLFVLGRRGMSAETSKKALGHQVERVVRSLDKPILTVTDSFTVPERILIAFDGSAITRKGVEMVANSPLFRGLPIHVLMCKKESKAALKQLDWATKTLTDQGFVVESQCLDVEPEAGIIDAVESLKIDMLLMGAYSHSPWRSILMGSKTAEVLRSATIPMLLLR